MSEPPVKTLQVRQLSDASLKQLSVSGEPVASFDLTVGATAMWSALAQHREVLTLEAGDTTSAALPRSRARKFALEAVPGGFAVHCASAGSGSTALGLLPSVYLIGKIDEHDDVTHVDFYFRLGRPNWALQRAMGFAATSLLAVLWALLAQPGVALGRWVLVGLFAVMVLPVVVRDLAGKRQHQRHRRELLALIDSVMVALGQGAAAGERGPYRVRRSLSEGEP